jgi:phosphopantetheinyl transferase (holo-ACP synthase)
MSSDNVFHSPPVAADATAQDNEHREGRYSTTSLPVLIRLPRTVHDKPYIPLHLGSGTPDAAANEKTTNHPATLSVSHQFPFVGAAQLQPTLGQRRPSWHEGLHVGCDIVVQEPLNTRLYSTWNEFLQVYKDMFANEEWIVIQNAAAVTAASTDSVTSTSRIHHGGYHEFLLRWAAKEAYTKALGVGLGFDFASFSIRLELPESCNGRCSIYLATCCSQSLGEPLPISLRGSIHKGNATPASSPETWDFTFVFLSTNPWSWACVAVGPRREASCIPLKVQWTSLEELIPRSNRPEQRISK